MTIRSRIFIGILCIVGVGFFLLLDWIVDDLTPQYRESTEEPLVDAARILASIAATGAKDGKIDLPLFRAAFDSAYSQTFEAQIYQFTKTHVDYRVYITNAQGIVIFDSENGRDEGKDYSEWRDVNRTLSGEYGARTSRDIPGQPTSSVLYVAAPIMSQNEIIGVLTVGKPTRNANQLIEEAKRKIIIGGAVTCFAIIAVVLFLSGMVTQPIERLTEYARAIRDGRRVSLPELGKSEIGELGVAFEEMRDALEGKQYVENYVQTLTHEVKSPLSAIRGAVELMNEDMPAERRRQFLDNIGSETERIRSVVDKLLLLSSLENRKGLDEREDFDLGAMISEVCNSLQPLAQAKGISLNVAQQSAVSFRGEPFLVRHAVLNIVQNAIDFSPQDSSVDVALDVGETTVTLSVSDSGPGIPEYAQERIFERFYSLKRPDTGLKSSGLGLSLVREVAQLHSGTAEITNRTPSGTIATLTLPH